MYDAYEWSERKCDGCGKTDEEIDHQIKDGELDFCDIECQKTYHKNKKQHEDEMNGIRIPVNCTLIKVYFDDKTPEEMKDIVDEQSTYLVCYDGSWETGHFSFEHFPQFRGTDMWHQLNYGGDKNKIYGKWQAIYKIITKEINK